jgi:proline iminopeptidase
VICPPGTADRLHRAWPEAAYHLIPDAGHAAMETGIARALVAATNQFKQSGKFS